MKLLGGKFEPDLEFKNSEINHLRLMLAWLRCEYMLDEHMQAGYANGVKSLVDMGYTTEEQGRQELIEREAKIKYVPKYVRQAVKMLSKMVAEHDAKRGDIVDGEVMKNRLSARKN